MSLKKLNKVQKQAVEAVNGPVLIFAGAGSGKTRVLTHKMWYLINECDYKPENILALTFTNKAAKEMRDRVKKLLKTNDLPITIGTFHSVCARLLRDEATNLGFSRNFAIYDETKEIGVPESAVTIQGNTAFVYIVNEETAEKRDIVIGKRNFGKVSVLSGISEGDLVISEGVSKVRNKAKVKIINP